MAKQKSIVQEVEAAESLTDAAEVLCRRLQLPDLHSAQGLAMCNTQFKTIWGKLKEQWAQKNERLTASICIVFGKMSVDYILETKLAKQGVVGMLIDVLESRALQLVALQTLSIMTSHRGARDQLSVAGKGTGQVIVDIAKNCESENDPVFMYATMILCSSSFAAYGLPPGSEPERQMVKRPSDADAGAILDLLTRATKQPDYVAATHAFGALAAFSHSEVDYISRSPDALKCIVGHLRHLNLVIRIDAYHTIYNTYIDNEEESPNADIERLVRAVDILKKDKDFRDIFVATRESELFTVLNGQGEYRQAMMQNAEDRDMLSLGSKLYNLIMKSEWSIADDTFESVRGGRSTDGGLPYVYWFDALPLCAKALRDKDPKSETAIVLEIKYELCKRRFPQARAIAERWIKTSNPECSYCYYALSTTEEEKEALKWAKKGLRTKPQGYIRHGLLFKAIDAATDLAFDALAAVKMAQSSKEASKLTAHAMAYLKSVMKDSEEYIKSAPLDTRMLRGIITRYLGLYIAFKGSAEVSPDLRELQPLISKLALVERFSSIIWEPVKDTPNRATWKIIEKYHKDVANGWDNIFARAKYTGGRAKPSQQIAPDDLGAEVESLIQEAADPLETDETQWEPRALPHQFDDRAVELLTCSECFNPSAQVMKCGRCGGARYCDISCQKKAWPTHKKVCVAGALVKVS